MKKLKCFKYISLLPLMFLVSCNKGSGPKIICPTGAPSLTFYDQGDNSNFVTISDSKQIVAQFQNNVYDALIIDATNGLEQIRLHPETPYRFAKLLTSGNLYLVSYTKSNDPSVNDTILSFGNANSIPYLVSEHLNKTWKSTIEYKDTVKDVLMQAIANPTSKDYYLLAEPVLTALKDKKGGMSYAKSFNELLGTSIPQAALFINKNKKDTFKSYITSLDERINNCINNVDIVKNTLDKYSGDDSKIANRFGFANSEIVKTIQSGNGGSKAINGFAIYPDNKKYGQQEINDFLKKINYPNTYSEDYFINLYD